MSVGRYNPNGIPVISPTVYQQNADDIQRARQVIDAVERKNEVGKANFEHLQAQEQELRRIAEMGRIAAQRLEQIQQLKAEAETNTRLIPNQSATSARIEEVGTSRQTGIPREEHASTTSFSYHNFQSDISHQGPYVQTHQMNAYGHPSYADYTPGPSFDSRQYNASYNATSSADAAFGQAQTSSYLPQASSYYGNFVNAAQVGSNNYHPPTTFQHSGISAMPSQSVHQKFAGVASYADASTSQAVPVASAHRLRNNYSNTTQHSQQSMYHTFQAVPAGNSSTSSLDNALDGTYAVSSNAKSSSSIPPNTASTSLSNGHKAPNVPAREQVSGSQPQAEQSSGPVPASTSTSQPGQFAVFRRANQQPIPVAKNPTVQELSNMKERLASWAKKTTYDPTNSDRYFFLNDWQVFCVEGEDRTMRIVMMRNGDREYRRYTLDEFFPVFLRILYPYKPEGTLPSAAPPTQPVQGKAQNMSQTSAPIPNVATIATNAPAVASSGTPQSQSTRPPTTPVLTPSSAPNTSPGQVPARSPRHANKKTIARDLLFNLGKKRPRAPSTSVESTAQPPKRQAFEESGQTPRAPEPGTSSTNVLRAPLDKAPPLLQAHIPQAPIPPASVPQMRTAQAPAPSAPVSQNLLPDLSKRSPSDIANALAPRPAVAGPIAPNVVTSPAVAPRAIATEKLGPSPSGSSNSRPAVLSVPKEQPPQSTAPAIMPAWKARASAAAAALPSSSGRTSISAVDLPPITTISSTGSSSTQSSSRPLPVAQSKAALSQPQIHGPVASTSKLPERRAPEPLFLPSSSPEPLSPGLKYRDNLPSPGSPEIDIMPSPEPSSIKGKSSVKGKTKGTIYVLVPPEPEYLIRYREQVKKRVAKGIPLTGQETMIQGLKRGSRSSSVSTSTARVGEEDFTFALEAQHLSPQDDDEREAVRLACTRLQELPCRWNGCDCVLNSVQSLIRHLRQHQRSQSTKSFMCKWTQCGQHIRSNDGHLERHALLPFRCAYTECEESFRSAAQLLKHFRSSHEGGTLRPSYKPSPPEVLPLQPLPDNSNVPSYLFVTNPVKGTVMSKEAHEVLGRWVARNITTSGVQVRSSRPRKVKRAKSSNRDPAAAKNDYEFLTTRMARYSTYVSTPVDLDLADLNSADISRMIDEEDFTLWGSEGGEEEGTDGDASMPPDSPLFSPRVSGGRIEEIKTELEGGPIEDISRKPHDEDGSDDENAAVEIMLTGMTWSS